ncbi:hypothetical protein NC651_010373 [Populus alba x Populus x berolinensis]|nr:hypothetical protein NC651_010373 [Populus alba x Populus x berolinensis]
MEDTTWEQRLQALTHLLTSPATTPPLYSQFFISTQIPCYLKWDYPPILCNKDTKTFPSLLLRWGFSLFLKRASRLGCPETSWRSKCPYQQPPPLILAKGLEEAQWGDEQRREYVRKRLRRKKLLECPGKWKDKKLWYPSIPSTKKDDGEASNVSKKY